MVWYASYLLHRHHAIAGLLQPSHTPTVDILHSAPTPRYSRTYRSHQTDDRQAPRLLLGVSRCTTSSFPPSPAPPTPDRRILVTPQRRWHHHTRHTRSDVALQQTSTTRPTPSDSSPGGQSSAVEVNNTGHLTRHLHWRAMPIQAPHASPSTTSTALPPRCNMHTSPG